MPSRSIRVVNPFKEDGGWTPPRGYHGHFLPQDKWDSDDLRAYADYLDSKRGRGRKRKTPLSQREKDDLRRKADELIRVCEIIQRDIVKKNPVEALSLINPRRQGVVGRTFVRAVDYVKDNPLLVGSVVGVLALTAYVYYRVGMPGLSALHPNMGVVRIVNGYVFAPNQETYRLTDEDRLWLIRMLWGEVARSEAAWSTATTRRGGAAVAWASINHYMTVGRKREIYPTFAGWIQAYSTPIQNRPGAQEFRSRSWESFPENLRSLVNSFVLGTLRNPVGTRTDWRMLGTGYYPIDRLVIAGNVFGTNPAVSLS